MKFLFLLIPVFAVTLSSCDMANKINQSTCDINANSDAIERSTVAVNNNLAELDRIKSNRG